MVNVGIGMRKLREIHRKSFPIKQVHLTSTIKSQKIVNVIKLGNKIDAMPLQVYPSVIWVCRLKSLSRNFEVDITTLLWLWFLLEGALKIHVSVVFSPSFHLM